ncbi:amidohydrolase family protein [Fulvimonas soli]|jgi:predicted TIM-barrel fold metal-dependent hydrolase|nr:amidohydrolase family protein [Fulvimonas soli]
MNDLILLSVDDHVIEPPDLFDRHLPAKYRDKAPKMHSMRGGQDSWTYEGMVLPNIALNAVVGRPREEYGVEPTAYNQLRAGTYDIKARIDDMNVNGVCSAICFPTFPQFAGTLFVNSKDKEAAKAIVSAYNDWHIHEWAGAAPGRIIPLAILPLWDINACVEEARRVARLGVHTVTFPDVPAKKGLPSIHTDYWDPLWKVMSDNKMVISTHIGSGMSAPYISPESPIDSWITTMPMSIANAAADWMFSPVFVKFPELKIALSEGGIGWIPYLLERADFTFNHHRAWTHSNFGGLKPSDIFFRNFITCFIDDIFGLKSLDFLNTDMVTWECDYPHSDTVWPYCPEDLWKSIKHLPKETIDKITHLNTMREFSFDPFSALGGRENCTVGALRAQATHVDTQPRGGLGGMNPSKNDGHPVTSGEVMKMFAV